MVAVSKKGCFYVLRVLYRGFRLLSGGLRRRRSCIWLFLEIGRVPIQWRLCFWPKPLQGSKSRTSQLWIFRLPCCRLLDPKVDLLFGSAQGSGGISDKLDKLVGRMTERRYVHPYLALLSLTLTSAHMSYTPKEPKLKESRLPIVLQWTFKDPNSLVLNGPYWGAYTPLATAPLGYRR